MRSEKSCEKGVNIGMTYDSFAQFMEEVVLPMRQANPEQIRLDGRRSGGNRAIAGKFQYKRRVWKVHADTHYEPLLIAYHALTNGQSRDPFVEENTAQGRCLDLTEELRRLKSTERKYLYIYGGHNTD
jgi:hypothetical protein